MLAQDRREVSIVAIAHSSGACLPNKLLIIDELGFAPLPYSLLRRSKIRFDVCSSDPEWLIGTNAGAVRHAPEALPRRVRLPPQPLQDQ